MPGKGRPIGVANKLTQDVRVALATFAEENVDRLQAWLDQVAEKDPGKAADLYLRVIEYHIPRLARTELSGADAKGAIDLRVSFVDP